MELRVQLSEPHRAEAKRMYEDGSLRDINRQLLAIGVHLDFVTRVGRDTRPRELLIYAEERTAKS